MAMAETEAQGMAGLVINPGSTSTKIAAYRNTRLLFQETIRYASEVLREFSQVYDQLDMRLKDVLTVLENNKMAPSDFRYIMGRGGALKPVPGGVFAISSDMLEDLKSARYGDHASSLGACIAWELGGALSGTDVWIADPPVVDELDEVARITGHPAFVRTSRMHTLNQKAAARKAAAALGKLYEEARIIVAHLGGGISVGVHRGGRIVDVNDAYDGDGPFSPERSGALPAGQVAKLCFSGRYSRDEIRKMMVGAGGVTAYLGTSDMRIAEEQAVKGEHKAGLVLDAMVYQIAKEIGAAAAVLDGAVDAVVVTGSIAQSSMIVGKIRKKVGFIAPCYVYPGEFEMTALRDAALRVLNGEQGVSDY
jgi:butyrate kinase